MVGQTLSHYRLLEEIGAGGMGVVYRARDERLRRDVAVKILPPGLLADEAARRRFRKEALALSQLNHPNIATVHDFDSQGGVDFLVMEMIEGKTLSELLARGPLPEPEILRLADQLLQGLAAAHAHGVIHRDLKPSNIRVNADGRLKILDFGLAFLTRPSPDLSSTASVADAGGKVGTLPYMSPEQLRGSPPDVRSDIFAAGAVLYEMACGRRAFAQDSGTEVIGAILQGEFPAPRTLNPRLSPGLERVISKALQKEPGRRYQSARELAAGLDGVTGGGGRPRLSRTGRRIRLAAGLLILATAIVLATHAVRPSLAPRGAYGSIAVLPFENATRDASLEYLSDGITEGLINTLSTLPSVEKVISRASVFEFKGKALDPCRTGARLGVRCLVVGRIARGPDGYLVSAEVVDTRDGRHLWGRRYSRTDADLTYLERDIASDLSNELDLTMTDANRRRLAKQETTNQGAYRWYLKGLYTRNIQSEGSGDKAIECFNQAIAADPTYALAYVGLSETYALMATQEMAPKEAYPKARAAALQALSLDPDLGEAHAALATVEAMHDWAWVDAEREFGRAIELSPSSAMAHMGYGVMLTCLGRNEEALVHARRAKALDPVPAWAALFAVYPLWDAPPRARRLADAIREYENLRKEYPGGSTLWSGAMIHLYVAAGRIEEALREADRIKSIDETAQLGFRGYAYASGGRQAEARRILAAIEQRGEKDSYRTYFEEGLIRMGLGEHEKAFDCFERAIDEKNEDMLLLGVGPLWDPLRSNPRFKKLLARMNLPQSLADG